MSERRRATFPLLPCLEWAPAPATSPPCEATAPGRVHLEPPHFAFDRSTKVCYSCRREHEPAVCTLKGRPLGSVDAERWEAHTLPP